MAETYGIEDRDYTYDELNEHVSGIPLSWIRRAIKRGDLIGREVDGHVFINGSSFLSYIEPAPPRPQRIVPIRGRQVRLGLPVPLAAADAQHRIDSESLRRMIRTPCIYFLLDAEGAVLYVGQSVTLLNRVGQHILARKEFSSVAFIEVPMEQLDSMELAYIEKYNPPMNKVGANGVRL